MRILVIADIHGSKKAAKYAGIKANEMDAALTVIAGDITDFGSPDAADIFSAIGGRIAAVPGNCDPPEIVDAMKECGVIDLHGKRALIDNLMFAGLGASNPMPFSTLFTYSEENIHVILDSIARDADVLVTHTPPYGILDRTMFGHHAGSKSIRRIVEKYRPKISIFGHIHESPGVERMDGSLFINPGPAKDGNAAFLYTDKRPEVKRMKLFSR